MRILVTVEMAELVAAALVVQQLIMGVHFKTRLLAQLTKVAAVAAVKLHKGLQRLADLVLLLLGIPFKL